MAKLARKTTLAVVELAVGDDADSHATAQVEVEHVLFAVALARVVFGIAACSGVVLDEHIQSCGLFESLFERGVATGEVHIAVARLGIYATYDASTQAQNLAALDATSVEEGVDVGANLGQTTPVVREGEGSVILRCYHVVFQVGNHAAEVVATDVDARKVDSRVGQAEDVGPATACGFDLAVVDHDSLGHKLAHEFGHGGHAYVECLGQFGQSALPIYGHVGYDALLYQHIFVGDAFEVGVAFVLLIKEIF